MARLDAEWRSPAAVRVREEQSRQWQKEHDERQAMFAARRKANGAARTAKALEERRQKLEREIAEQKLAAEKMAEDEKAAQERHEQLESEERAAEECAQQLEQDTASRPLTTRKPDSYAEYLARERAKQKEYIEKRKGRMLEERQRIAARKGLNESSTQTYIADQGTNPAIQGHMRATSASQIVAGASALPDTEQVSSPAQRERVTPQTEAAATLEPQEMTSSPPLPAAEGAPGPSGIRASTPHWTSWLVDPIYQVSRTATPHPEPTPFSPAALPRPSPPLPDPFESPAPDSPPPPPSPPPFFISPFTTQPP
ncbi:hypothetical protein B9Z65_2387 [Elsinoe australis]|uniref:Uncharacterized protein n=1 Tax=Elsinoe australis TaxID=40998 RepID=A0A2P7ZAK4_9PEZI|nr:hypothetical protein B9Z65_2387 [Elsinoe australis]